MRILLTGGGTAGHVIPNIAIVDELREHEAVLHYIGSKKPIDSELVRRANIRFTGIHTGKFRRYFSLYNFVDFFKIPIGFFQSLYAIHEFDPDVIFSKGGYVTVPVVVAGRILGKKIIIHESDVSPGLATKFTGLFADKILVTHEKTVKKYSRKRRKKVEITGLPIRPEVLKGTKKAGYEFTGFTDSKPVVLAMGGSLGALKINNAVWASLTKLIPDYQIVHISGKGKTSKTFSNFLLDQIKENYKEFEYIDKELPDVYAIADIVITRAGANSLAEIEPFGMPAIAVPLPDRYSRGDQMENARAFHKKDKRRYRVIKDKNMKSSRLIEAIEELSKYKKRHTSQEAALKPAKKITKILLS